MKQLTVCDWGRAVYDLRRTSYLFQFLIGKNIKGGFILFSYRNKLLLALVIGKNIKTRANKLERIYSSDLYIWYLPYETIRMT